MPRYRVTHDSDGELVYTRVDDTVTGPNVYDVFTSDGELLHIKKESRTISYILQSDSPGTRIRGESEWYNVREFDDLDHAIKVLRMRADMARIIWNQRVIDKDGKIYARYVVDDDMRLPGCRWRAIERNAYFLWEAAGRPDGQDEKFWLEAELNIGDHNGVYVP
jgi:hypothetical protein